MSSNQSPNWTLGPYIVQTLFLLLAPALLAASVYMFLGRIILVLKAENLALLKRKWLTKVFVTGDVLSFMLQGAGKRLLLFRIYSIGIICWFCLGDGIQSSGNLESMKNGEHLIVVGLVVQILFFGFFLVTATHFYWKIKKYPMPRSCSPDIPWRRHLNILYLTSFLIMVRSIFRLIEYIQGNNGYILHHEMYLYVFDALLMFMVMVIFNIIHPQEIGRLLRSAPDHEMSRLQDEQPPKPYERYS